MIARYLIAAAALCAAIAHAQPVQTSGATIVVPAYGEVTRPNDEAHAVFAIEEQDKDKAAAASRVNTKMKRGVEILRREDPSAKLQTRGYYTYPVYAEEPPTRPVQNQKRQVIGWRVGQYVDFTTTNLARLAATVAAAQQVLALNGLQFGLSRAAQRELDRERIEAAWRNLNERVASILHAMGRSPADAAIDTVDFEGSGNYAPQSPAPAAMRSLAMKAEPEVAEPSFEPGETTLTMRVVGRVKVR